MVRPSVRVRPEIRLPDAIFVSISSIQIDTARLAQTSSGQGPRWRTDAEACCWQPSRSRGEALGCSSCAFAE